MRVGLIACSAGKLDRPAPAAELYTGPVFTLAREWITARTELGAWAILSAKHGLVMPDQVVEPYDVALASLSADEKRAWAARTREQLVERFPGAVFMVLAGADYRAATEGLLVEDVIGNWTAWRRERGLRPAHIGIGLLKKYMRERKGYPT